MIDHSAIFKAKQEIHKLLREKPEYVKFQKDLEFKLKNAGNSHNRMVLLKTMMMDRVRQLTQFWTGK